MGFNFIKSLSDVFGLHCKTFQGIISRNYSKYWKFRKRIKQKSQNNGNSLTADTILYAVDPYQSEKELETLIKCV